MTVGEYMLDEDVKSRADLELLTAILVILDMYWMNCRYRAYIKWTTSPLQVDEFGGAAVGLVLCFVLLVCAPPIISVTNLAIAVGRSWT